MSGENEILKRERMEQLRKELKEASESYYNDDKELMSNYEYDKKFDELSRLEEEFGDPSENFTEKVGRSVKGQKVTHKYEAKSLGKTKDVEELFSVQSEGGGYCDVSWKLDGCTLQLTYNNGKLFQAVTRGDGVVGQDVTENAAYISGIPKEIAYKEPLTIRGEVTMSYAEFERQIADGGETFANARNLASATLTALDSFLLEKRHLDFRAFELVHSDTKISDTFEGRMNYLKDLGFGTVPFEVVPVSELKSAIKRWSVPNNIAAFGTPVDGLVVTNDNCAMTDNLKGTAHHPNLLKGMAFKWEDQTADTILREIEWSPSRTGRLTPVAVFDSVSLEGTTVSRASVHNLSILEGMNLKVGDTISVYKANMIIPQIAENKSKGEHEQVHYSVTCPCCKKQGVIHEQNNVKFVSCENWECTAKEIGRFAHLVSKHGLNIEGLAESTIATLVGHGIVGTPKDFFHLDQHKDEILALDDFGEKSYENLINAAEKSRTCDFEHFYYACGIIGMGRSQLKVIRAYIEDNYEALLKYHEQADKEGRFDLVHTFLNMATGGYDFTQIEGIGFVRSENLKTWINHHLEDYEKSPFSLLEELTFTDTPKERTNELTLAGKTVVITGSLNHYPNRDALVAQIESLGGKSAGSVSKKTDLLVNNDITSTSGKNKKAKELGVPIVSEDDFIAVMNGELPFPEKGKEKGIERE
jgi:DNA ligase (NAD+)